MTNVDRQASQARRNRNQLADRDRMRLRNALPDTAGVVEFRRYQEALEAYHRTIAVPAPARLRLIKSS